MSGSIRKTFLAVLAGSALLFGAGNAAADFIITLDEQNGTMLGSGPYGEVTVTLDSDPSIAHITFTADGDYVFVDSTAADVNLSSTNVTISNITFVPTTVSFGGTDTNKQVDGFGKFTNIINMQDASVGATEISFDVQLNSGTWASAGSVLTTNTAGNYVAAHMWNTTSDGGCTGKVSDGTGGQGQSPPTTGLCSAPIGETVPIPAAAWLFVSGLLGLIAVARRRIAGKIPVTGNLSPAAA